MKYYPLAFDQIRNLITTREDCNWSYIVKQVKEQYGKDISHTLPVYLTPNDFKRDSMIFDAGIVFSGWYAFYKTPVLVIGSFQELEQILGKSQSDALRGISHFIE